tara:strand:+ start:9784 stop:10950 length:1167 start_codon:yes stop_codon:yes gene_type:complete
MYEQYYCAPNMNNGISCYGIDELKKIGISINKSKPQSIRISNDHRDLQRQISDYVSQNSSCDSETCWKDLEAISRSVNHRDNFKPEYPEKWLGKKHQLSTSNINDVLKQYEKKHKHFKYYGALPIDFDLKENDSCVVSDICNMSLDKLMNDGITDLGIIFNTDPHTRGGEHWMSMYVDIDGSNFHAEEKVPGIYFFDSYGYKPCKRVSALIDRITDQGKKCKVKFKRFHNDHKYQKGDYHCGVYSIHFIVEMLKNKSFRDYLNKKILKDALIDSLKYQYYIHPSKIKKTRRLKRRKHELKGGSTKSKAPSKEQLDEWDKKYGKGKVQKEAKELMIPLMKEWRGQNPTGTIEEWWKTVAPTCTEGGKGKKSKMHPDYETWWIEMEDEYS